MLNAYVKRPLTRERYCSRPAGPHLDAFILWLEQRGYQPRRILRLMRGVHRFSQWAQENGLGVEELDAKALEQFHNHLQGRQPLRYPCGSSRPVILGARHFVTFLETLGLVLPTAVVLPSPPEPELLGAFRQWMRTHRGTTEATLNIYRLPIIDLLHALGAQPASFQSPPDLSPRARRTSWDRAGKKDRPGRADVSPLSHRHGPVRSGAGARAADHCALALGFLAQVSAY